MDDFDRLMEIEKLSFTPAEAATEVAFVNRIRMIPDTFLVAEENGEIVGFINGPVMDNAFITDDLFSETKENPEIGGVQSILGLAVHPTHRKKGIATMLLSSLEKEAAFKNRSAVTLTCLESLIPFYEKHGYQNDGRSESEHGGEEWFNMTKKF
ncbi:GNAT family N-acetyltransferase [Rummeliibacillus pycnus]|uniref:GNAT family N-acetyltransferase n=1 Tax=Rummeliibacillus pycnus TaxID=101070 RepID=UPI000C9B7A13|nr:GNAT family N-acetyltransferase [Rummeliibacillus pycnus]